VSSEPNLDEAISEVTRRETTLRQQRRWRAIFPLLALVVSAALYALFERQAKRLDRLSTQGEPTTATVTLVQRDGTRHYAYDVAGSRYSWSVRKEAAPYPIGETFPITYLPEDPSLSRPGTDGTPAKMEAASNRRFRRNVIVGVFVFFGLNLALTEVKLRKLRSAGTASVVISPEWMGRIVALLLLAVLLGVNLFADVAAVQGKAFGPRPLGIPVVAAVSIGELILFAPYFKVFEHIMKIVSQALRDGASVSKLGLVYYILRVHRIHPELRRSRTIALAGFGYFVVLAAIWIMYAESRGV
jgi:hypothetical protein